MVSDKQPLSPTLIGVIVLSAGFIPFDMDHAWNHSSVPVITWKIANCNHGDGGDPGIMKFVSNGTYDPYINRFSDHLKKWYIWE